MRAKIIPYIFIGLSALGLAVGVWQDLGWLRLAAAIFVGFVWPIWRWIRHDVPDPQTLTLLSLFPPPSPR